MPAVSRRHGGRHLTGNVPDTACRTRRAARTNSADPVPHIPGRWSDGVTVTVQDMQRDTARRGKKTGLPEVYDFRRPMTLAREHGRVLEMAFETYARQWGNQLSARLRALSAVTLESVAMHSYDEYVRAL